MTLTFNAIDVETANVDRASICQIGIVHVQDGEITDQWQTLVNPNAWFDPLNVSIHGINEDHVRKSPSISDIRGQLDRLSGSILISHTSYDRVALERALKEHNLEPLHVTWLDSAKIVRRAWSDQYRKSGWGLKNVAADLDITFKHHNALEDARAAAEIVLRACRNTNTGISDWLHLVNRPIFLPSEQVSVSQPEANPEGPLYGETILFTGELRVPRSKARELAAQAGCNVVDNASKKVSILVVGTQDESKLQGYEKSSKHRRIETLISKGARIDVLSESDFYEILGVNESEIAPSAKSTPRGAKKERSGVGGNICARSGRHIEDDEHEYDVDIYEDAVVPFAEILTYVEGASHYLDNLDGCSVDDPIALTVVRESERESIAVEVSCKTNKIGCLPRDLARKIETHLDANGSYEAFLENDWAEIGEGDADENNVGLIVKINLDVMPNELVKEGRKAELPTEESLEALRQVIEDIEGGR